ncbi:myomegalin-like isoform X3 [Triplophysa rosa]|uniref:myomegalin-like isoform X3 n=1 Tax=Triplophysa rosa TaxID=992332 RepID=UPI002545DBE5|nr:myomegalin-like isoform X3 [Triplophysa rosa]
MYMQLIFLTSAVGRNKSLFTCVGCIFYQRTGVSVTTVLKLVKMKEVCRICARELCGNQRRWIFHPASKLNLQVLLSYALCCDMQRDGRCEFICSKCSFMLERMYRFDTVIARVEALSIERLHRLLQEKERLRQCISVLYRKNNRYLTGGMATRTVDDAKYSDLLQDDLVYSMYESWVDNEDQMPECIHVSQCPASDVSLRSRRCRVCRALRVADSDYEAVCKVPRKVARSVSCGPSTRYSTSRMASVCGEEQVLERERQRAISRSSDGDGTHRGREGSAASVESLEKTLNASPPERLQDDEEMGRKEENNPSSDSEDHVEAVALALSLVRKCAHRPVRSPRGSKLPVLIKTGFFNEGTHEDGSDQIFRSLFDDTDCLLVEPKLPRIRLDTVSELARAEELWHDEYMTLCVRKFPKSLMEEQQSQLNQYECAAGQCVSDLQKAQLQVHSLQMKIHEREDANKKLQEKLCEMETELRSIRQTAQNQERTLQNLTDSLTTKDSETQELRQVIECQNRTMSQLRETHHSHMMQAPDGSVDSVVLLQSSLLSCQLQLESCQREHKLTERHMEDVKRSGDRLQDNLQETLQHRETTEQHNQELRETLTRLRSELQVKTCELKDLEMNTRSEITNRDKTITQLQQRLHHKHALLQEYSDLLDRSPDSSETQKRDALLDALKSRIRDRDRALEGSIDEKFRCLEEKDAEVRRLQQAIREKDGDLERLNNILNNNNDTITSLESLVRRKDLDLERTQESCQKLKCLKQQSDEKHLHAIQERDNIIHQLQTALHTHNTHTEELRSVLLKEVSLGPADVIHELQSHLSVKERLLQEVMSQHSRQLQEHHRQITELLDTISTRDRHTEDYRVRSGQVISERLAQVQELRRQLLLREQKLNEVNRERERDAAVPAVRELQTLTSLLKEKDTFIQELLQVQDQVMLSSTPADAAQGVCASGRDDPDIQTVREELQLTLKKHKQTEMEVLELRGALEAAHDGSRLTDYQYFLQQLVSEQKILNQSLRSETKLYQNLRHIQNQRDSGGEKSDGALHAELNSLQALRGQLEEVLARTRATALALERAALTQMDYGESSSDEDDEEHESSSEAFTDSMEDEDDEIKVTAHSLRDSQNAGMSSGRVNMTILSHNLKVGERCDVKVTGRTERTRSRNTLPSLHEKKAALHLSETGSQLRCESESGSEFGLRAADEVSVKCGLLEKRELQTGDQEEEEKYDGDEDVRAPQGKRGPPCVKSRERRWKRRCTRPHSLDLGALPSHKPTAHHTAQDVEVRRDCEGSSNRGSDAIGFWQHVEAGLREQVEQLRNDVAVCHQESRELQERLMVSEATVHALNDQLKDYRELLTESAVQRDSKQVQVDLQDLGYETSGRSENEAERENASSPEVDELETCISLSGAVSRRGGWHGDSGGTQVDDPSSLKRLVQDLRAQLSRCHKVIRGLQLRVRSLSASSDYGSSMERTPRKQVNWEFQSAGDEDEGWQSDAGPMKPSRELQELVSRVALLETQMKNSKLEGKSGPEEGKCATWPGKYNTLIQAQARELSHLRQRMREGRSICHILTHHLSDTTKAFEELLRANDIDYYMGQCFREQLSQSSSLAQRVSSKMSGRSEQQEEDKTRDELLAHRLNKELQRKDQIHTKLRPDTPCSSHAPFETTDQSDHTSFVSDDRMSTNEDLDVCSDMDVAIDFAQEDRGLFFGALSNSKPLSQNHSWSANLTFDPSSCQPLDSRTVNGHRPPMRTFSAPHSLSSYQLTAHTPHSFNDTPVSHHAPGHSAYPSHTSLMESSALWAMANIQSFDGSSYFQSGNSQSGVDVIEEHLREIRSLRQRLEDSIRTNERLRQQLEGRLSTAARETAAPTNIYIQSHDTVNELTNEITALKEENQALQSRLQTSTESSEEAEQLREAVLSGRVRLKQAGLEAERWKEELRRLQTHNCSQSQQIHQLRQDRQNNQEHTNRLQHEVSLLQQQLSESRTLLHSLQREQQLHERVWRERKSGPTGYACEVQYPSVELRELLMEVRALRAQLEHSVQENSALRIQLQKQLDQFVEPRPSPIFPVSPLRDALYRRQLLHDPSPSPPVRDVGAFPSGPLHSPFSELEENAVNTTDSLECHSDLEGDAPDGSFANRNGCHVIGHVDDYSALQQQVFEGSGLVRRMEATLQSSLNSALLEINSGKVLEYDALKTLLSDTKTLHQILDEAASLLKMFWRAALPSSDGPAHLIQREQSMRNEIQSLHLRIAEQEEVLQGTIQRLRNTNHTKESMEAFIVNQLSRTRDVLKKARANLEEKASHVSLQGLLIGVLLPPHVQRSP